MEVETGEKMRRKEANRTVQHMKGLSIKKINK